MNPKNLVILFTATSLVAAEPEKLSKLRASYDAALAKATAPIQKTYTIELEKLKTEFTKAGKLEDALAVAEELKKTGHSSGGSDSSNAGEGARDESKARLEAILTTGSWKYLEGCDSDGNGGKVNRTLTFTKKGECITNEKEDYRWEFGKKHTIRFRLNNSKFTSEVVLDSNDLWVGKFVGSVGDGNVRLIRAE